MFIYFQKGEDAQKARLALDNMNPSEMIQDDVQSKTSSRNPSSTQDSSVAESTLQKYKIRIGRMLYLLGNKENLSQ